MCHGIPASQHLIGGLASGEALLSGQSVTLQFSNRVFACGSWLTEITSEGCRNDWSFGLTLPSTAIEPGNHNLSALSAQFGDLFGIAGAPSAHAGCDEKCSMSAKGTGAISLTDPVATLEIYSVDEQCITGRISGLRDPTFSEAPDYNGAFFAVRCSR